jgi:hypothetical protein
MTDRFIAIPRQALSTEVRADDQGQGTCSTTATERRPVGATHPRQWLPADLRRGRVYDHDAVHKEAGGGRNLRASSPASSGRATAADTEDAKHATLALLAGFTDHHRPRSPHELVGPPQAALVPRQISPCRSCIDRRRCPRRGAHLHHDEMAHYALLLPSGRYPRHGPC